MLFVSVFGGVQALGFWAFINYTEPRNHTPYWGVFLFFVGPALVCIPFLWLWGRSPRLRSVVGSVADRLGKWIVLGVVVFMTIVLASEAILLLAPLARRFLHFVGAE